MVWNLTGVNVLSTALSGDAELNTVYVICTSRQSRKRSAGRTFARGDVRRGRGKMSQLSTVAF